MAPSTRRALHPRVPVDFRADEVRSFSQAREEVSKVVAVAVAAASRPKPVHAFESKFWASSGEDGESDEVDLAEPTTPEFIQDALAAGFSVGDLVQAENTLTSGINPNSEDRRKADFIVSTLVDRRLYGKPWQGPLPTPRVSPPRTLGDVLVKATCQRQKNNRGSAPARLAASAPASRSSRRDRRSMAEPVRNSNIQLLTLEKNSQGVSIAVSKTDYGPPWSLENLAESGTDCCQFGREIDRLISNQSRKIRGS